MSRIKSSSTTINTIQELQTFINQLQQLVNLPAVFFLQGELGAGKTEFVKKFLEKYLIPSEMVNSPTYNLIQTYETQDFKIYHLDLYRLEKESRLISQELKDIFTAKKTLVFIEWAERLEYDDFNFQNWQIFNLNFQFSKNHRMVTYQMQQ